MGHCAHLFEPLRALFGRLMNKMAPGIVGGPNVAALAGCLHDILGRS